MPGTVKKLSSVVFLLLIYVTSACGMEVLCPLYSYPKWWDQNNYLWDDIAIANGKTDITAIINHNNGPGGPSDPNSDYMQGLNDMVAGDVTMIGYVYTSYGARNLDEIKADVDKYYTDYVLASGTATVISGIFLDEASSSPSQSMLDYYEDIYRYVRNHEGFDTVVLNHGTNTPEAYTSRADINVLFEGDCSSWDHYQTDQYVSADSASHFAALVHGASESEMMEAIDLAVLRGIGSIYVSDDSLPNPWNTLPSYWEREIDYIEAVPEPSSLTLLLLGAISLFGFKMHRKGRQR